MKLNNKSRTVEFRMSIKQQIKNNLNKIKQVKGVENAVLTQRDGNPIQSAGVWLSKNEVFNISSATSAIYNLGLHLHYNDLKYILIEGKSAKIFLAPLRSTKDNPIDRIMINQGIKNNNEEFFIAITAFPNVNLGGIFLQTRQSLIDIKRTLILSGDSFKPPLRKFNKDQLNLLLESFNVKEDNINNNHVNLSSISFSEETISRINSLLNNMASKIIDMKRAIVTTSGGFLLSQYSKKTDFSQINFEHEAAMSYSLFSTSNKCAWLLKKMKVNSILLECDNEFQFITGLDEAVFSLTVQKGKQKLGLLRLILPRYMKSLENILNTAKKVENPLSMLNIKDLIGELCLK